MGRTSKLDSFKEEIIEKYQNNTSIKQLSDEYQVSRSFMLYYLNKNNIRTPRRSYKGANTLEYARRKAQEYRQRHPEEIERSKIRAAEWRKENREKALWKSAQQRAKKKGLEFTITPEDIIIPEYCPLLKVKLEQGTRAFHRYAPSLDRIDSSKGYTKDNIWVISNRANAIKNDASLEELEFLVKNFKEYLNSLNNIK